MQSGGLTVRKADLLGGKEWPKKPMPVAERQQETGSRGAASFRRRGSDNWPDTGRRPDP